MLGFCPCPDRTAPVYGQGPGTGLSAPLGCAAVGIVGTAHRVPVQPVPAMRTRSAEEAPAAREGPTAASSHSTPCHSTRRVRIDGAHPHLQQNQPMTPSGWVRNPTPAPRTTVTLGFLIHAQSALRMKPVQSRHRRHTNTRHEKALQRTSTRASTGVHGDHHEQREPELHRNHSKASYKFFLLFFCQRRPLFIKTKKKTQTN